MIGDCATLADIGTDHGQLPIAAVQARLVIRAIAIDVAPGPLSHAVTNIFNAKVTDRVFTRLGDGFEPLAEGEADVVVITGMGGMGIMNILEAGSAKAKACRRLVLQPQRNIAKLRKNLHRLGYYIAEEKLAREADRFYVLLSVTPSGAPSYWNDREYSLGKLLVNDPEWNDYVKAEIALMEKYIAEGAAGEKLAEYTQRLEWLKEVRRG